MHARMQPSTHAARAFQIAVFDGAIDRCVSRVVAIAIFPWFAYYAASGERARLRGLPVGILGLRAAQLGQHIQAALVVVRMGMRCIRWHGLRL